MFWEKKWSVLVKIKRQKLHYKHLFFFFNIYEKFISTNIQFQQQGKKGHNFILFYYFFTVV